MGFSRQEYCSGLPFPSPGDLPNPGIKPASLAWQVDINDTKEEDGGGGIRITKQRELSPNVIFEEHNGAKQAVVKKEIEPLIKGVVVVAEGADYDNVRMNLQMAAKILTDIPIHKISVFVMEK